MVTARSKHSEQFEQFIEIIDKQQLFLGGNHTPNIPTPIAGTAG
jgi:hypothetical protein